MIQDLLNSSTDGHKVTLGSTAPGITLNTSGSISATDRTIGTARGCGWNDPVVTYPANPCEGASFPTVAITGVIVAGVTEWYLKLTFTSCAPFCNTWEFSYAQTGPEPVNQGGVTFTIDCAHLPNTYSVRIYPSYAHSPHFIYTYTITNCCGTSNMGTVTL